MHQGGTWFLKSALQKFENMPKWPMLGFANLSTKIKLLPAPLSISTHKMKESTMQLRLDLSPSA